MKKLIALLALLLGTSMADAAGWTPPLTVSRAFTEESDLVVVYTSDGGQYSPGCSVNTWILTMSTDARRGRAWAAILTALASGQNVMFWYNDSCSAWNYHGAMSVMLAAP